MSLWKRDTEVITRAEEVALSMAVNLYIEEIKRTRDRSLPSIPFTNSYRGISGRYWKRSTTGRRISTSLIFSMYWLPITVAVNMIIY